MKKHKRKSLVTLLTVIIGVCAVILGSFCVEYHLGWISVIAVGMLLLFTAPVIADLIISD